VPGKSEPGSRRLAGRAGESGPCVGPPYGYGRVAAGRRGREESRGGGPDAPQVRGAVERGRTRRPQVRGGVERGADPTPRRLAGESRGGWSPLLQTDTRRDV